MMYFTNLIPTYIPDINRYILISVIGNSYLNFFDLQLSHFFKSNMIYFLYKNIY